MSEIKVNKISPRTACGTTTLGDSGDTFTIPSGVTISNLGTAAGFGGTGEISWDTTVKTNSDSGFTATAGVGYFLNTTAGTITVNLPAGAPGSSVAFADYAGTWQTYAVTVSPNGTEKMGGVASDVGLNTEGQSVQFVYIDAVQGWINVLDSTSNVRGAEFMAASGGCISTCGNDKIHKFIGPGTFTVCTVAGCSSRNVVSYMVVAGGGGGGGSKEGGAGGGGAGGFREVKNPLNPYTASPLDGYPTPGNRVTVSQTAYPITVGGGGTANVAGSTPTAGDASVFSSITSAGGGTGGFGASPYCGAGTPGGNGGSGGGGHGYTAPIGGCGAGTGNTPPTTPAQGTNGGTANVSCSSALAQNGGGGGGATDAGDNGENYPGPGAAGDGGDGATTSISTAAIVYGGGGGGGRRWDPASGAPGTGGTGGGGTGGNGKAPASPGTAGTVNLGAGGGGGGGCSASTQPGGNGGSGIVIIRYKYQ
jgi:hypothetical protein